MASEIKEKFGIFKEIVELLNKKRTATLTAIMLIAICYLVWKNDRDKDKLYGMVIKEVKAQVKTEVAPIKSTADSTKKIVDGSKQTIDTLNSDVRTVLGDITKKYTQK